MANVSRRMFLGAGAGVLAQAQSTTQSVAPSDRVSVGMIAVGSRAQELLEAIKKVPGTEIVGVCDAYTGRVERAVERTEGRAKVYKSYKDILADPAIDVVTVATPDHWHKQMVIEALEAGSNITGIQAAGALVEHGVGEHGQPGQLTVAAGASGVEQLDVEHRQLAGVHEVHRRALTGLPVLQVQPAAGGNSLYSRFSAYI